MSSTSTMPTLCRPSSNLLNFKGEWRSQGDCRQHFTSLYISLFKLLNSLANRFDLLVLTLCSHLQTKANLRKAKHGTMPNLVRLTGLKSSRGDQPIKLYHSFKLLKTNRNSKGRGNLMEKVWRALCDCRLCVPPNKYKAHAWKGLSRTTLSCPKSGVALRWVYSTHPGKRRTNQRRYNETKFAEGF